MGDIIPSDIPKIAFESDLLIDKVLEIYAGSFTTPATISGSIDHYRDHPTGINDFTYFAGVFSVDGGNGTDIGSHYIVGSSYVQVVAGSSSNNLGIYAINFDTVAHDVTYQIAVISKPSNTLYTPQNLPDNSTYFDSRLNYQKIAFENTIPITINASSGTDFGVVTATTTIPHNLGYRPAIRAFLDNGSLLTEASGDSIGKLLGTAIRSHIRLDNNNVYFDWINDTTNAFNLNLNYRIYYDPNRSV